MKKERLREVKWLDQEHTACNDDAMSESALDSERLGFKFQL